MVYLYILKNSKTERYYIGSTIDLKRRLKQHLSGNTKSTRVLKTDTLIYTEEFRTEQEARDREKLLKSYKSSKYIEWLIKQKNKGR